MQPAIKEVVRRFALAVPQIRKAIETRDAEIARLGSELARRDVELARREAELARREAQSAAEGFAPGHFYSVLPDVEEVRRTHDFRRQRTEVPGIDLRTDAQLALLQEGLARFDDMPFPLKDDGKALFFHQNGLFGFLDAFMVNTIMRKYRPRRVIEVGSGFSSALMMSIDRLYLDSSVQFTFIDAYEIERLRARMERAGATQCTIVNRRVQEVDLALFDQLEENDIFFVDSSHVSKPGSDVNHIIFEILPRLRKGVIIHFHDIHWPFELFDAWILQLKYFWNESYLLRAFLEFNSDFELLFFNDYVDKIHPEALSSARSFTSGGGSIWLRRKSGP